MAPKAKPKPKATLIQKHAAEQRQQTKTKPTQGKTWEYVCDCNEDDCDKCAPRKKIDTFEPAHAARRSMVPARLQDEPSAPAKAAVPKAAAPLWCPYHWHMLACVSDASTKLPTPTPTQALTPTSNPTPTRKMM